MDSEVVYEKFCGLAGLSAEDNLWQDFVLDACRYIERRKTDRELSQDDVQRLELLAAAYAFRLFSLRRNSEDFKSFSAGDVRITSSADSGENAEKLWNALCAENSDLLRGDGFLFGRVI